jgi:hypothetical protein
VQHRKKVVAVQLVGSSCVGAAGPAAGRKGGVEPLRYLLDLTNRRGPTGFSGFYLPELSGPENRGAMTRFVICCRSDRRGPVLGQTRTEQPTEPLQKVWHLQEVLNGETGT